MRRRLGPTGPFDLAATANLASLALLGARDKTGGDLVWVQSLRRPFVMDPGGGGGAPGQVVPCVDGSGAWRSLPGFSSPASAWATQTEWHIDANTGNVEGLGTAASPINSWRELLARVGGQQLPAGCEISVHSDLPEVLDISQLIPHETGLVVSGEPGAIVEQAGVVTTYAGETAVPPGGEAPIMTSVDVPDWTPWIGRRVRFTSGGAENAMTIVAMADPAGTGVDRARVPDPSLPAVTSPFVPTHPNPVGCDFAIERLPNVVGLRPSSTTSGTPIIVRGLALPESVWPNYSIISGAELFLVGCTLGDVYIRVTWNMLQCCRLGAVAGLGMSMYGGMYFGESNVCYRAQTLAPSSYLKRTVYQGGLQVLHGSHWFDHVGFFDGSSGLRFENSGCFGFGVSYIYGSGNANYGVFIQRGGSVLSYQVKPIATGAVNDVWLTGAAGAWALIPAFDVNTGAGIVTP